MKLEHALLSVLLLKVLCFAQCKKDNLDENGLPPATQEGQNTFGFLLNGQPWAPKGNNGTSNLTLYYSPSYRGGVFNIHAYRIVNHNLESSITIASDSIQQAQTLYFGEKNFTVTYKDDNCEYRYGDPLVTVQGRCTITKIDKVKGVFAGTFEFVLSKKGCESIRITEGRFDMKF